MKQWTTTDEKAVAAAFAKMLVYRSREQPDEVTKSMLLDLGRYPPKFVLQALTYLTHNEHEAFFSFPLIIDTVKRFAGGDPDWDKSEKATLAMGKRVGINAAPGESWAEFRGRIRLALNQKLNEAVTEQYDGLYAELAASTVRRLK